MGRSTSEWAWCNGAHQMPKAPATAKQHHTPQGPDTGPIADKCDSKLAGEAIGHVTAAAAVMAHGFDGLGDRWRCLLRASGCRITGDAHGDGP